jgi:macrolide transport system ATP-binding/permease protein
MAAPLIRLHGICRDYPSGEGMLNVLCDIDLEIAQGEFVAIIGASGSGKSTLMNLLGCLDRPSSGSYLLDDREVSQLEPNDLAALRREFFGFIFQRYHLLSEMTALGNVEVPAIYRGLSSEARRRKARDLLDRLGMGQRLTHRPGQLSGGQQQRVSIARALVNDARVILADEPTGALDSRSGEEVLTILDELNAEGRTVIIVTHDPKVAARAHRVIEIADGRIVSDRGNAPKVAPIAAPAAPARAASPVLGRLLEALRMAVLAMRASVVSVVALGEGSRQQVLSNIAGLGTNTLQIYPGRDFGDMRSGRVTTLVMADADALARQPWVASVSPTVSSSQTLRHGANELSAQISGVGEQYFDVAGITMLQGRGFDAGDVATMSQNVVIDENTRNSLFGEDGAALGEIFMAGNAPLRVIGVARVRQQGPGGSHNLTIYAPYTSVQARYLGTTSVSGLTLRVHDNVEMSLAQQSVTDLLTRRHGSKDFFTINNDEIRQTITSTTQTLTLLIAAIAVISLLVGGDEHHAGLGHRACRRNRPAHGRGRTACRHPLAIPDRGSSGLHHRRCHRHSDRAGVRPGLRPAQQRFQHGLFARRHDHRPGQFLRHRAGLRLSAGGQRIAARPGNRPGTGLNRIAMTAEKICHKSAAEAGCESS